MDLANDDRIPMLIEEIQRENNATKISLLMTELLAALDEKRKAQGPAKSDGRMAS